MRLFRNVFLFLIQILTVSTLTVGYAFSQIDNICDMKPPKMPVEKVLKKVESGFISNNGINTKNSFSKTVKISDKFSSIRLFFSEWELGERSYIVITSLADNYTQKLGREKIEQWNGTSAYFNGNAVQIELYVGPGEQGVYFSLGYVVGEPTTHESTGCSGYDCSGMEHDDDRNKGQDTRIARVLPYPEDDIGIYTAWTASNGTYVTVSHGDTAEILEYKVPDSDKNGALYHPAPEHQFKVDKNSWEQGSGTAGSNDWAVFDLKTSPQNEPPIKYGNMYRLDYGTDPEVKLTGYGVDYTPTGDDGCENSDHLTLQFDEVSWSNSTNHLASSCDNFINYNLDAPNGTSGAPVESLDNPSLSYGIQFACSDGNNDPEKNAGVYFENQCFWDAFNPKPDPNITYVDKNHPKSNDNHSGESALRPITTIKKGIESADSGDLLFLVRGYYNEAISITKKLRLKAEVGEVVIDPTGTLSESKVLDKEEVVINNSQQPDEFELFNNYPNPFNPKTTIKFVLAEKSRVTLEVYNLIGQKVSALLNNRLKKKGTHRLIFNAKNYASGVYVYKLSTRKTVISKKMTILK